MTVTELDKIVRDELSEERLEVYYHKKKHDARRVIVTCSPSLVCNQYRVGINNSKNLQSEYNEVLRQHLERNIGFSLGEHTPYFENGTVGSCAEPHAANYVIKDFPDSNIDDFVFSPAYLFENPIIHKPYCGNCLRAFKQLNNE